MSKILFVTSFASDMYHSTGKNLIDSFLITHQTSDLLVCHENINNIFNNNNTNNLIYYALETDPFLNGWLKDNLDIIPEDLGGRATPSSYPKIYQDDHIGYMNYRASRFFRKIASLHYALKTYRDHYDWIVWIDSDCQFNQVIPTTTFDTLQDFFYFMGNKRLKSPKKGVETGLVGFHKDRGYQVLQEWIDKFTTQTYRNYQRWDDGWVFLMLLKERNFKNGKDLGKQNDSIDPINAPQPFYRYISHHKGHHRRTNVM